MTAVTITDGTGYGRFSRHLARTEATLPTSPRDFNNRLGRAAEAVLAPALPTAQAIFRGI